MLGGTALIFFMALQWADVVEWVDGSFRLKPKRAAAFEKQKTLWKMRSSMRW